MTATSDPMATSNALAPDDPARLTAQPSTRRLADHLARYGLEPTDVTGLIPDIERAGLRGRGGAGFPTATKLAAVAARRGAAVVVANGTEGEPLSAKDKTLLHHAPHLVLDGLEIAARVTGGREQVLCVERGHPEMVASLQHAVIERRSKVRIVEAPKRYLAGEESALVHWINGGEAKPTLTPPRPFEKGVGGRPTLVDNVETLANLALIARFGADWYRALGTETDPGTRLLTVSGGVAVSGVYEVPGGTPLVDVLRTAGAELSAVDAVLVGGYFGTWVANHDLPSLTLDPHSLSTVGASPGCGAVFALPAGACGLVEAARVTRWLSNQSARQCGPCTFGLDEMARAMDELVAGRHAHAAWDEVGRLLGLVAGRGACKLPDGAVRFVQSTLTTFRDHVALHAARGPCAPGVALLPTPNPGGWR